VLYRPLWEWAKDLIENPRLSSHFRWDAERIFKRDGGSWTRVFNEPWTADAFWDVQVCTHSDALSRSNDMWVPLTLCSRKFLKTVPPCASSCMLIKVSCQASAQQRDTLSWHVVRISPPLSEMGMVLAAGALSDGCRLYDLVFVSLYHIDDDLLIKGPRRWERNREV
jgi:hypothetical protein